VAPGQPDVTFPRGRPLTKRAVAAAARWHAGQRRDADGAAFVVHPLEVAALLDRSHYPDHVVAAAVLHDVLENTDRDFADLRARFGPEVAELVAAVSDDPSIEDEDTRKRELTERVRRTGGYAAAVYAADKISKVREIRMSLAAGVPRDEVELRLRRHRASLAMLDDVIPGSRLVATLRFEIEALAALPPAGGG
jgi:(p)ppGpp synthase/HD superfamily hydrolase